MADIIAWFFDGPHDNEALLIAETDRYTFEEDGSVYVKFGMTETGGQQKHQFRYAGDPNDPGIADPAPQTRSGEPRTFGEP